MVARYSPQASQLGSFLDVLQVSPTPQFQQSEKITEHKQSKYYVGTVILIISPPLKRKINTKSIK